MAKEKRVVLVQQPNIQAFEAEATNLIEKGFKPYGEIVLPDLKAQEYNYAILMIKPLDSREVEVEIAPKD